MRSFANKQPMFKFEGIIEIVKRWLHIVLAMAIAAGACVGPQAALAEDAGAKTAAAVGAEPFAILAGDTEIEQLTSDYEAACGELAAVGEKIDAIQAQVNEVEAALPAQQARSDAGLKQRYIMQSNPLAVLEPLLSSATLGDFLRQVDYLDLASRANLAEFNRLRDMKSSLEAARAEQERLQAEAEARTAEAEAALRAVQAERAREQADAQGLAVRQAGEMGGKDSIGVAADGGKQPDDYKVEATTDTSAIADGADWYADRDAFVEEWGKRIDAYLEGSPLAGQGANFAAAAWKYGVDPRWSPAISNTESSKGAVCIRPHNAWGWGAADSDPYNLAAEWGSWEEAIDAHVSGLTRGYGYTISMGKAKTYCPPNWQSWYNNTLREMARI